MGCDGGSLPHRADMVKTKGFCQRLSIGSMGFAPNSVIRSVTETIDPRTDRRIKMTTCFLTNERLTEPIVACRAGYFYNKESIVGKLLQRSIPKHLSHITSLKDLISVKYVSICPITSKELIDGNSPSLLMWPCGCLVSEKALGLRDKNSNACIACNQLVDLEIIMYPSDDDVKKKQLDNAHKFMTRKKKKLLETMVDFSKVKRSKVENPEMNTSLDLKNLKSSRVYDQIFHPSK